MKVGTVISKENSLFVVTKTENGYVIETERLEDYVARNVMIQYDGDLRTIKEIIEIFCDDFLSKHEVIEK